jgi:metallophosphoesterase superfamily enzyme
VNAGILKSMKKRGFIAKGSETNSFQRDCEKSPDEHRIYIIGDSHVKGLSDKVRNGLDEAFRVNGITKPKADIERITSTLHFLSNNLTKNEIIFYGGSKDISKKESISAFCSLKAFVQTTANTKGRTKWDRKLEICSYQLGYSHP